MGGKTTIANTAPMIGAFRVQNSAYGLVVPIVWGQTRITGNLMWYGDFQAIPHTTTESNGGKGGGVETQTTTYTYQAAVMVGLAEGHLAGIGKVWVDKEVKSLAECGLGLYPGTDAQAPWAYLSTYHPDQALGYSQTAYVAAGPYRLNDNALLPQHSFEVMGRARYAPDGAAPIFDANPRDVITEFLTHPQFGAGFPASRLDAMTSYGQYCVANGLFLSPALSEQRTAASILEEWAQITNANWVWSGAMLKLVPYGDEPVTGNGVTYTPDTTPRYDLTDDDFLPQGSGDPVTCERGSQADAWNQLQVEYLDRAADYNIATVTAKDLANIEVYGLRPASPEKYHAICDAAVAGKVADLRLKRKLYIRNVYNFRLGWKYALLEPMDLVTLTDSRLGLDRTPVRIVEIDEDADGALTIKAEEWPFGVAGATSYPTESPQGYAPNFNVAPGPANAPVIFEPPADLTNGTQPEVWLATSGGADWGGAEVWVSDDGASYRRVGTLHGPARHGSLSQALPEGPNPDPSMVLNVDLSVSGGTLLSGSTADAERYNTLCWVDGELLAYATATLTAASRYELSYLVRGIYGTPLRHHGSGMPFVRLDAGVFKMPIGVDLIGRDIFVKLCSFNRYGGNKQSLAEVAAYPYRVTGVGYLAPVPSRAPIHDVKISGLELEGQGNDTDFEGETATLVWRVNSSRGSFEIGAEPRGGDSGFLDPVYQDFVVRVYAGPDDPAPLREDVVTESRYRYTRAMNRSDGLRREFTVEVCARDKYGQEGPRSRLTVRNPAPALPGALSFTPGFRTLFVNYTPPADEDFVGLVVWMSPTAGFTPGPDNQVYHGPDATPSIAALADGSSLQPGATYYVRVAAYDAFGTEALIVSLEFAVTTLQAQASDLAAGIVGTGHLAAELESRVASGEGTSAIVAEHETKITTLGAQYTFKVDADGYLAGFGLAVYPNDDGVHTSQFLIRADSFAVVMPSYPSVAPFAIGAVNGVPQVVINSTIIGDATIGSAAISNLTVDKLAGGTIGAIDVVIGSNGRLRSGQSAFGIGTGFWLGNDDGTTKFSISNGIDYLLCDGNVLEFSGRLFAASGTFSGDLDAAGGTFAGALSAATGTFSGSLSGATGTFSGTLSGGTVSGGIVQTSDGRTKLQNDVLTVTDDLGVVRVKLGRLA
ncbi:MAG: phage tail protein [Pseudomonadota bacterium]